jgi:hypothetical protein
MTMSGQTRLSSSDTGTPSMSPARTPSRTYVAGDRCESTCIHGGRMSIE